MTSRSKPTAHLLTMKDLAERWGCSLQTITRRRNQGALPRPLFNADLASGFKWSLATIEAFERGEDVPMWWPRSSVTG